MPEKIAGVRERREPGFFIIDNEIISRFGRALGVYGVAVYAVVKQKAWAAAAGDRVEISQREIGRWIDCHQKTVGRMLRKLRDLGLVSYELIDNARPDLGYEIFLEPVKELFRNRNAGGWRRGRQGRGEGGALGARVGGTPALWAPPYKEERARENRQRRQTIKPSPNPSLAGGELSTRDRRQLREQLALLQRRHLDQFGHARYDENGDKIPPLALEEMLEIACRQLVLPIGAARASLIAAGYSDQLKKPAAASVTKTKTRRANGKS